MSGWGEPLEIGDATPADLAQALENRETGFGQYLGAQAGLGFADTSTSMLGEAYQAGPMAPLSAEGAANPAYAAEGLSTEGGARGLTQDEFKGLVGDRQIPFNPFLTKDRAQALIDAHDLQQWREWLVQQRHAGPVGGLAGFAAGMVGGLPDPINFLPLGEAFAVARGAKQLTRSAMILRHAAGGVVENVVGTAALEPAIMARHQAIGDDYSFTEAGLDILMGGLLGGAVGAGTGWWHSRGIVPDGHPGLMPPAEDVARAGEVVNLAAGDVIADRPVAAASPLDRFRDNLLGEAAARPEEVSGSALDVTPLPPEQWVERTAARLVEHLGFDPGDANIEALVQGALRDEHGRVLDAAGIGEDAFSVAAHDLPGRAAEGAGERPGQPRSAEPGAAGGAAEAAGAERAPVAEPARGGDDPARPDAAGALARAGEPGGPAPDVRAAGPAEPVGPGRASTTTAGGEAGRPAAAVTPGERPPVQRGVAAEALSIHEQIRRFVAGTVAGDPATRVNRPPRPLSDASTGRPVPDPAAEVKAELERPEVEPAKALEEFPELLDYQAALADGRVAPEERAAVEAATAEVERLARIDRAHDQAAVCILGGLG